MNPQSSVPQEKPVSISDWIITLIVLCIPVIGIIMLIYWALSDSTSPSKKNYCRACIFFMLIGFVISALFLFAFGGLAFLGASVAKNSDQVIDNNKYKSAKSIINTFEVPLFSYRMHAGDYPSTTEGLQALLTAPDDKGAKWRGPYVTEPTHIIDPWGEVYQYQYPGTHNKTGYDLWSKGPDGQSGTADDIVNWKN